MNTTKSEARQIPMGKCGHKITRVKRGKVMLWYCYDAACDKYTELDNMKLQARGKIK